jgi:toxin ParE1/3/4
MIVLSPDAVADVERLRTFLDQANPGAARRAMAAILTAIERLPEYPDLGMPTGDADIRQLVIRFGASTSGTSRTYNGPRISRALMRATF